MLEVKLPKQVYSNLIAETLWIIRGQTESNRNAFRDIAAAEAFAALWVAEVVAVIDCVLSKLLRSTKAHKTYLAGEVLELTIDDWVESRPELGEDRQLLIFESFITALGTIEVLRSEQRFEYRGIGYSVKNLPLVGEPSPETPMLCISPPQN